MTEYEIFAAAIKLTGDQRAAYLQAACGANTVLRQGVEALLQAHDHSTGELPRQVDQGQDTTQHFVSQAGPGTLIAGRYKLLEPIGEGGMGSVWLAEQKEPVKRKVALKLVKAGMDSAQVLARFEAERQALALMDHPHIARVFDGGVTEQGRPFFVMEYVKGVPLTEYCDQARLSVRQRLELFIPICRAVQHAHQKGIIHRDLKPSNLLVCPCDGQPIPKVIDFGLAKAMHQPLTEHTLHTAAGIMLGTPLYMSPEQAEPNNLDVDTRADIYSLGVVLYELLTGTTPLEKQQFKQAAYHEILRLIKEVEPPRPSTRLSGSGSLPSVAAQRGIDPKQLTRVLTGDLDWIVMKALDKDRVRRYETANGFARDIERYLAGDAVEATPLTAAYRLRKFVRKHRVVLTTTAAFAILLIAGTGISLWQAARARSAETLARANETSALQSAESERRARIAEQQQRTRAEASAKAEREANLEAQRQRTAAEEARKDEAQQRQQAEQTLHYLVTAFRKPDPAEDGRNVKVVDVLQQAYAFLERAFPDQPLTQARLAQAIGETYSGLGLPAESLKALERVWEIRRRELGDDHAQTVSALAHLARACQESGDIQRAVQLKEQLVDLSQRVFGPNSDEAVTAANNLAVAYEETGRTEQAIAIHQQNLERVSASEGPDSEASQVYANNLAMAYLSVGRTKEAVPLLERVFAQRSKVLPPDHPDLLESMNNLSIAFGDLGEHQRALDLARELVTRSKAKLGDDHPDTLIAINSLALDLQHAGMADQSAELLEDALGKAEARIGQDHPVTIAILSNLALAYVDLDQPQRAAPLHRQVLDRYVAKYGPNHPRSISASGDLADVYRAAGDLPKAISEWEEALRRARTSLSATDPVTLNILSNLGTAYLEAAQSTQALPFLKEALEGRRASLGAEHPDTLLTLTALGKAHLLEHQLDLAIPLLQDVLAKTVDKMGAAHFQSLSARAVLAEALSEAGELERAEELCRENVDLAERHLGPDHAVTVKLNSKTAEVLYRRDQFDAAIPIFERVVNWRRDRFGPNHTGTLNSTHYLALSLRGAGRTQDAARMLEELVATCAQNSDQQDILVQNARYSLAETYLLLGDQEKGLPLLEDAENKSLSLLTTPRERADALSRSGDALFKAGQFQWAEQRFRKALDVFREIAPDDWHLFAIQSQYGIALARQQKFSEAETELLAAYEGLEQRKAQIPATQNNLLRDTISRLVDLYTAWQKPDRVSHWRALLP